MQTVTISIIAVLAATAVHMLLGTLLHGVIFKKIPVGVSRKKTKMTPTVFAVGLVGTLLFYCALAYVLAFAEAANWVDGMLIGFGMWLGFIAPMKVAAKYVDDVPWKTTLVNMACMLVSFLAGGAIIAGW